MNEELRNRSYHETLVKALAMAASVHCGQLRKGTKIPYISHPMAVAAIVIECRGDLGQAVAAILHDAVEDAKEDPEAVKKEIRQKFGEEVLGMVRLLTKPEAWEGRREDGKESNLKAWKKKKKGYLDQVRSAPKEVRLIALADKLHNARAILADYRVQGESLWDKFNGPREGTLWYYEKLVRIFRADPPHPALFQEFERTMADVSRLAGGAAG